MPNNNSFRRKDFYASRDALAGAALAIVLGLAFSQPPATLVMAGVIGVFVGQIFSRWRLKRNPSAQHEEPLAANSVFGFTVWTLCCIGLGAGLAYVGGVPIAGVAKGLGMMAVLVAAAIASTMIAKRLEEKQD